MSDVLDPTADDSPDNEPVVRDVRDDRFEPLTTLVLVAIGAFLVLCILLLLIGERRPPPGL